MSITKTPVLKIYLKQINLTILVQITKATPEQMQDHKMLMFIIHLIISNQTIWIKKVVWDHQFFI